MRIVLVYLGSSPRPPLSQRGTRAAPMRSSARRRAARRRFAGVAPSRCRRGAVVAAAWCGRLAARRAVRAHADRSVDRRVAPRLRRRLQAGLTAPRTATTRGPAPRDASGHIRSPVPRSRRNKRAGACARLAQAQAGVTGHRRVIVLGGGVRTVGGGCRFRCCALRVADATRNAQLRSGSRATTARDRARSDAAAAHAA